MAKLIVCAECGKQVSSSVISCPHCGLNPHTTTCNLCGKTMKMSEQWSEWNYTRVCEACIKKVMKDFIFSKIQCKVCHSSFAVYREKELLEQFSRINSRLFDLEHNYFCPYIKCCGPGLRYKFYCPKCGEESSIDLCSFCGMFISKKDHVFFHESQSSGSISDKVWWMHKSCKSLAKKVKRKKGCFIATAMYGENSPEVQTLRIFRDNFFASSKIGRLFIRFYYILSPPIATLIVKNSKFNFLIRKLFVSPIFRCIKHIILSKEKKNSSSV